MSSEKTSTYCTKETPNYNGSEWVSVKETSAEESKAKPYIVVEVSDRNHHLCKKQMGKDGRYTSLMNGRSRFMVAKTCDMLNEQAESERIAQVEQAEQDFLSDKKYMELVAIAKERQIVHPGNWARMIIATRGKTE